MCQQKRDDDRRGSSKSAIEGAHVCGGRRHSFTLVSAEPDYEKTKKKRSEHSGFEPQLEKIVMSVVGVDVCQRVGWLFKQLIDRDKCADARSKRHKRLCRRSGIMREDNPGILQRIGREPIEDSVERKLHGQDDRHACCCEE